MTNYESPASNDNSNQLIKSNGENKELIYDLDDLEELIAICFQEKDEEENDHV
ncbi:9535_t:CDS:1, partial [Ambispora leptoticha]